MKTFRRCIMSFDIEPTDIANGESGARVYALNVRGTGFLWHQVMSIKCSKGHHNIALCASAPLWACPHCCCLNFI